MRRHAALFLLALGLSLAAGPASAQPAAAPSVKSLTLKLDGQVKSPASFSLADLKAMPVVTVNIQFAGQEKNSFRGVSLMALLDKAGTVEPAGGGAYLRHLIVAHGTDNYAAGIAIGEIDAKFEGKPVIIAYEENGKPLDSLRLIVPGDTHAGRAVRDLAELTVN